MLLQKIKSKTAKIGIVGLGYVGLPLALRFSEEAFQVTGFDIDPVKVRMLNDGKTYIRQYSTARIQKLLTGGFRATTDFKKISQCDAIILCVPTPLGAHNEPDLSFIRNTLQSILPYLKAEQALSLESTTYPGTTDEEILPLLLAKKLTPGKNFYLLYSPEREDPGNTKYHTGIIPKIVSGTSGKCLKVAEALYGSIVEKVVPVSSTRVAEMTKIIENTQRLINIALMNEMKLLCDKMDIDPFEVVHAAATKPFGFSPYYPGPGVGGHCIPVDPLYLTWKAREYGINTRFIELASEVNTAMPHWVVQKTGEALNKKGIPLKKSKILILGLAYKRNVDDVRESPATEIISVLQKTGAKVSYCDPYVPVFPKMRGYHVNLKSVKLTPKVLRQADAVILITQHDDFDYDLILKESRLLIDTRGRFSSTLPNVVRA